MKRIDCLAAVYPRLEGCAVVTIMGAVAAELNSLGHRPNFIYLQHGMGLASSVGLGLALCQPERRVVVLDGDGSVLMNLGTLTTLAQHGPPNLTHVIFDNGTHLSTGGSPTATSKGVDLAGIARSAGITRVALVEDVSAFATATDDALSDGRLSCIVAKVEPIGPPSFHMDVHMLENRFAFARAMRQSQGTL